MELTFTDYIVNRNEEKEPIVLIHLILLGRCFICIWQVTKKKLELRTDFANYYMHHLKQLLQVPDKYILFPPLTRLLTAHLVLLGKC